MARKITTALCAALACAAIGFASSPVNAGTIIKLNLGGVGPDIELAGSGVLSTFDDGIGATTGDQNTAVEFSGFLDGGNPDINTSTASVTIDGLTLSGPAIVSPGIAIQSFSGGIVRLYGPAPTNTLLLQGVLTGSTLVGTTGAPGNGGLFSATFGNVTGGTLDSLILDNSLTLQMTLANINGGAGLVVPAIGSSLAPFIADAAVTMAADPVPEPATVALLGMGGASALIASARRRK